MFAVLNWSRSRAITCGRSQCFGWGGWCSILRWLRFSFWYKVLAEDQEYAGQVEVSAEEKEYASLVEV